MTNFAALVRRVPQHCVWDLTNACNLRCVHCELAAGNAAPDELSTKEALRVADELIALGCRKVSLTGGEPLLRPDWSVIAEHLARAGLWVSLVTNGLPLSSEVVDRAEAAGVSGVSVSLDGLRAVHDRIRVSPTRGPSRFEAAVTAIERVAASSLRPSVITQVNQWNLAQLDDLHELLCKLGVELWQVQLALPLGRLLEIREPYLIAPTDLPTLTATLARFARAQRLRLAVADSIGYYDENEPLLRRTQDGRRAFWTGCMAGCMGVSIASNGDVKGCPTHPAAFVAGNVRQEPFRTIWEDRSRFSYNTQWKEELLEGECARCEFRRLCRAGCTSMAYAVTGTIYDNPYCVQRVRV
jgi:radical SAM protein with 4Fe4S-binding SPASM domain